MNNSFKFLILVSSVLASLTIIYIVFLKNKSNLGGIEGLALNSFDYEKMNDKFKEYGNLIKEVDDYCATLPTCPKSSEVNSGATSSSGTTSSSGATSSSGTTGMKTPQPDGVVCDFGNECISGNCGPRNSEEKDNKIFRCGYSPFGDF